MDGASTPAIDTCHPQPFQRLSSAAAGLFFAFPLPFQWTVVNFVAAFPCVSTTLTKCTVLSTDVRRTRCGDRCLAAVASGGRGRGPTNAERLGGQRHQSEVIRAIMLEDSLYLRGREEPAGVLSIELSTSPAGGAGGGETTVEVREEASEDCFLKNNANRCSVMPRFEGLCTRCGEANNPTAGHLVSRRRSKVSRSKQLQ